VETGLELMAFAVAGFQHGPDLIVKIADEGSSLMLIESLRPAGFRLT